MKHALILRDKRTNQQTQKNEIILEIKTLILEIKTILFNYDKVYLLCLYFAVRSTEPIFNFTMKNFSSSYFDKFLIHVEFCSYCVCLFLCLLSWP